MSTETENMYHNIRVLYRKSEDARFAIGAIMNALLKHHVTAKELEINLPFSRSAGYLMLHAYRAVETGLIDKEDALSIGYLKSAMFYREHNYNPAAPMPSTDVAVKMTVKEFTRFIKGYPEDKNSVDESFRDLSEDTRLRLHLILQKFGAVRRGRGLEKKSEAMTAMVTFLEQALRD